MWVLFILSWPIGFEEPKVTRYAEFEVFESCDHAMAALENAFTQNEVAICLEDTTYKGY
jgi:hypothetical protein